MKHLPVLAAATLLLACAACAVHPKKPFDPQRLPPQPDYARMEYWAAHPDKDDPADRVPEGLQDAQKDAAVDVFFLHPTTYTGDKRRERHWNADVTDAQTNAKTDASSILFQASLFNGAGRVFAPRYRQAHLHVFFTKKDSAEARAALDVAYADVKSAFLHYLEHWNQGRPFILAAHSQGARHTLWLLKELIEGQALEKQLVAAYVVGWPVKRQFFQQLQPCESPEQTDCYCSWRTWERKYGRRKAFEADVLCTNPLNWSTQPGQYMPKSASLGAVITPFEKLRPHTADAEVHKGILLCRKPKFPGSILFLRKNYHIGDLNLYYADVRENARRRAEAFLRVKNK
jgi:hypothetical protein